MNVEANGIRINYEVSGESGPTLLLVHGLGGTLRQWHAVTGSLSPVCRVVACDLRGHGGSDKPGGAYSVKLFGDDLAALLKAARVERCIPVGASLAAAVVIQLAADHPELVRALVTVGGFPVLGQAGKDRMNQRGATVEEKGMEAVVDGVLAAALGATTHASNPALVGLARATLLENDPKAYAASCRAVAGTDVQAAMAKVKCPALLVFGTEEKVAPLPAQMALKKGMPQAQLKAIPSAGHLPFLEQPAAFTGALMEFVAAVA